MKNKMKGNYCVDLENAYIWYEKGKFKVNFGQFCDNIKLAGWRII